MRLDDLSGFIVENGKKAVDKAKEAASYAKITADIKAEEVKLRSMYAEIGKLFCEQETGEVDEAFIPLIEKVSQIKMNISSMEIELQKTKGVLICPECGASASLDSKYCNKCGAEFKHAQDSDFVKEEDISEDIFEEKEPCNIENVKDIEKEEE